MELGAGKLSKLSGSRLACFTPGHKDQHPQVQGGLQLILPPEPNSSAQSLLLRGVFHVVPKHQITLYLYLFNIVCICTIKNIKLLGHTSELPKVCICHSPISEVEHDPC